MADTVFAKEDLAEWLYAAGVEYHPFASLADVMNALPSDRQQKDPH